MLGLTPKIVRPQLAKRSFFIKRDLQTGTVDDEMKETLAKLKKLQIYALVKMKVDQSLVCQKKRRSEDTEPIGI